MQMGEPFPAWPGSYKCAGSLTEPTPVVDTGLCTRLRGPGIGLALQSPVK